MRIVMHQLTTAATLRSTTERNLRLAVPDN